MLPILIAFVAVAVLNLCYYFGFLKFTLSKPKASKNIEALPVSVIICAKNEAENLRESLPAILSQEHSNFEVIVINDASSDDTLEVIEAFQKRDERLKIVNVENNEAFWAKKKYALTLGIKKAKNPYLLFTDADCRPQSNEWISEMAAQFQGSRSIVLGYGGYFIKKWSFLNKIIRFETLFTAIQYFSYATWGSPYMGVGRNLAYTSKEFYKHKGFASHLHLRSGDDDLFVNEAATSENTAICTTKSAITRSVPKSSFRSWFTQKRRHVSVAGNYKTHHKFLLGLFFITQFLFWILFFILLFGVYWKMVLGIFILRIFVQFMVFYSAAKQLQEVDLVWIFPFLELFLICAQFGIFISNIISKPVHWK